MGAYIKTLKTNCLYTMSVRLISATCESTCTKTFEASGSILSTSKHSMPKASCKVTSSADRNCSLLGFTNSGKPKLKY